MSHSGGAMKLMMAMTLLTTSHGIGNPINTSLVTGGYSASRCNGLTDTGCHFAHSELDFDLESMLDSEFSIRLLQTIPGSIVGQSLIASHSVSCNRPGNPKSCRGPKNRTPIQEHCREQYNRGCHGYH
ncbi:unnamed protein product [Prunus brigantina]